MTLKRAYRAHFLQLEIRQKKRDILSEKRESGMALNRREFTPESGTVDTMLPYPSYSSSSLPLLDTFQILDRLSWAGLNDGLFSETMDFRDFPSVLSVVRIPQS